MPTNDSSLRVTDTESNLEKVKLRRTCCCAAAAIDSATQRCSHGGRSSNRRRHQIRGGPRQPHGLQPPALPRRLLLLLQRMRTMGQHEYFP